MKRGAAAASLLMVGACGEAPRASVSATGVAVAAVAAPAGAHARQIAVAIETVADDDSPARFVVRDRGAAAFFVESGFAIALRDAGDAAHGGGWGLHMSLPGARGRAAARRRAAGARELLRRS